MRKFLMSCLVGGLLAAAPGVALADDYDDRDDDRAGRYAERYDDRDDRRYDERYDRRIDQGYDIRSERPYDADRRYDIDRYERDHIRRGGGWAQLDYGLRDRPLRGWVMRRFDTNRDGFLTRAEAYRAERAFERVADRNGDGRLTPREIAFARGRVLGGYGEYAYRR